MKKPKKTVLMVRDFKPQLRADMESKGMFRCGVIMPPCPNPIYCATYNKKAKIWRNWCLKHALELGSKDGAIPLPENN